jgi:hypothetical protein
MSDRRSDLVRPVRQDTHHAVMQSTTLVVFIMGAGQMLTGLIIGVTHFGRLDLPVLVQLINVDQGHDAPDLRNQEYDTEPSAKASKSTQHMRHASPTERTRKPRATRPKIQVLKIPPHSLGWIRRPRIIDCARAATPKTE